MNKTKQNIEIFLCSPRGFCAGVTRAIQIVEKAIEKFGAPIYVRHEIVHNKFVVKALEEKGAVFVGSVDEVPAGKVVIFSAHGVPRAVKEAAAKKGLMALDATCPLVDKVHNQVSKLSAAGVKIFLMGHGGHAEVIGTMGQLPKGEIVLLESKQDVQKLDARQFKSVGFVTQTTLSVDETSDMVAELKAKFPDIVTPKQNDICYATTNRQSAVKKVAPLVDTLMVIGSPNSSNSKRLVEVAKEAGCINAMLIEDVTQINWDKLQGVGKIGITAGASAPEQLIVQILLAFKKRYNVTIKEVKTTEEKVKFKLPCVLAD